MSSNFTHCTHHFKTIRCLGLALLCSIPLSACDSDNKTEKGFSIQQAAQKYKKDTVLKGKVTNKKGSVKEGSIRATDQQGKVITSTVLKGSSHYSITIPSGTKLPIILTFFPSSDSPAEDRLIAAVIYTAIKEYEISILTTLIAKKAKSLGGYSHSNMSIAADQTVGIPDANKTSTGFRGDPTKQYGGWH